MTRGTENNTYGNMWISRSKNFIFKLRFPPGLAAATKKHGDFNRRFENDNGSNYMLAFKDGGDIEFIPGTDPPEPFTLQRYKEVSGFGYSRIYLYLLLIFHEAEPDRLSISDSEDEKDDLFIHTTT